MDFEKLQRILCPKNKGEEPIPVIRLLKATSAPMIIGFLYKTFKEPGRITITNTEMANGLADYLEEIEYIDENDNTILKAPYERAKKYIEQWANFEYIRQYPHETGEQLHELTSYSEKVIQWLESMEQREFVGTESRFKDILNRLAELVEESTDDPKQKIKELQARKKETNRQIDAQIRQIKLTGKVDKAYSEIEIKERFFEISKDSKELLADFKEVERNFEKITRDIYERQFNSLNTKGQILGYTLDKTEALEGSPQGKSFYAFWEFLKFDSSQEKLNTLINKTYQLLAGKGIQATDKFLRNLKFYLFNAGQKVIESNDKLMDKIGRAISDKNLKDRKKASELTKAIQSLALKFADKRTKIANFIEIEGNPCVDLPMEKTLCFEIPAELSAFDGFPLEIGGGDLDSSSFDGMFSQFEIKKEELLANIKTMLQNKDSVSLDEVVGEYPLVKGVAELLGYFAIASESNKHFIDADTRHKVLINKNMNKYLEIPRVIFTRND